MIFIIVIIVAIAIYFVIKISNYNKTSYKKITHNSYFSTMYDKGRRGEYEIYRYLKHYEKIGYKFLFNVYLPSANGKTTELDVLMISPKIVFAFESKNYSGWIFGNDNQKMWTQVLPTGRGKGKSQKEHFYNPVWQNKSHCTALKEQLPADVVIKSVVLFSNRCTLKDITVNSPEVLVANRRDVNVLVKESLQTNIESNLDVEQIYNNLYPYSQVSEEVKQSHIEEINIYKTHNNRQ